MFNLCVYRTGIIGKKLRFLFYALDAGGAGREFLGDDAATPGGQGNGGSRWFCGMGKHLGSPEYGERIARISGGDNAHGKPGHLGCRLSSVWGGVGRAFGFAEASSPLSPCPSPARGEGCQGGRRFE